MLAIFDNDGTICDTQTVEARCFALAIQRVTGLSLATLDWSTYEEPTSASIVRGLLAGDPNAAEKCTRVEVEFCRLLREAWPLNPGDFSPLPGAISFIQRLRDERIDVAIATGAFESEARFKLKCCGIVLDSIPHATSSDVVRRSDIIALAASRAGHALSRVVYFGDAPWDVRACKRLGIPMIGIGRRYEQLRYLGIKNVFRDYCEPAQILEISVGLASDRSSIDRSPEGEP
jgi:beta-phosphoglucomutase-like phosphatase (HAD superfamily)